MNLRNGTHRKDSNWDAPRVGAGQPPIVPGVAAGFNVFNFCHASSRSACSTGLVAPAADGRAITSTSSAGNAARRNRNDSRTIRLIRLRATARLLTLRETAKPIRACPLADAMLRKRK